MKKIQLISKNYPDMVALVDDEDYKKVSKYNWAVLYDGYNYYAKRRYKNNKGVWCSESMHRLILKVTDRKIHVDHIDGNGLNNQKTNLRKATSSQNQYNRRVNKNCISGYRGVTWHKKSKKWYAQIQFERKHMHIGSFASAKEASIAYEEKAKELFGEFYREIKQ